MIEAPERQADRDEMVRTQLVARGIRDERVLAAMRRVPRHKFVPPALIDRAYDDCALPVDQSQTISQPYMVARMTELLAVRPESRILEIGMGTGYQTAVLAELAAKVYTVEWHLGLLTAAVERLNALGYRNIESRCADGSLGWSAHAPYDGVLVAAGAPEVPEPLRAQIETGGTLVVPVGTRDEQDLVVIRRLADEFRSETEVACRFVRLRGDAGWSEMH